MPQVLAPKDQWFVVHVLSGQENKVRDNIEKRVKTEEMGDVIFEVLVPTERVSEIKRGKKSETTRKFFPGYLIVNMHLLDENNQLVGKTWYFIRETTGVIGFAGTKDKPIPMRKAEVDSMLAQMKVVSFLRTEFGFTSLVLDHPVIHVAIGSDGLTTNVPALKVQQAGSANAAVQQLFALSIDHLAVHNGELLWGDRKIPLQFAVHDTNLQMDYEYLRNRYGCALSVGKVDTSFQDFRPFSWMTTVQFVLGPSFADIKSLQWNSGKSSLRASGRISDFRNPQLQGTYEAEINLQEAAAISRRHDLREGLAEFKGEGHWSLNGFKASGVVALRELGWQNDQIALKKVGANAEYEVTDQQIRLSKLQGKVLGGTFTGDAQVENWLHSVP